MALFQKKPVVGDSAPLYSLGLSKTVLIVGLGNIGKEYASTRHNIGFECLDAFKDSNGFAEWIEKRDLKCLLTSGNIGNTRVILIKPTTYMNNSGEAVQAAAHFYKIADQDILVIHDELDLPFGQIRARMGGSSAGNNGVESVIQHISQNFGRLRVGIDAERPSQMAGADFVLGKFSKEESAKIKDLTREVTSMITEYVASGDLPHDTRTWLI